MHFFFFLRTFLSVVHIEISIGSAISLKFEGISTVTLFLSNYSSTFFRIIFVGLFWLEFRVGSCSWNLWLFFCDLGFSVSNLILRFVWGSKKRQRNKKNAKKAIIVKATIIHRRIAEREAGSYNLVKKEKDKRQKVNVVGIGLWLWRIQRK